jgi:serine O-acetyltransferase
LGNIVIGGGSQVGAGTLVIEDLPPNSVAVGVPAKIIGSYKAKVQPSQNMDQVGSEASDKHLSTFSMDGI